MSIDASVGTLFDTLREKLDLQWADHKRGRTRGIEVTGPDNSQTSLVGHLNLIHPHRVQILGDTEIDYLNALGPAARSDMINQLFSGITDLIIIGDGARIPDGISQRAAATTTPIFTSSLPTQQLVNYLQYYLTNLFAEKTTLHGVFMEVFSLGMLITGAASVGKSELALELIARGHRLVADDAAVFAKTAPDVINGHCPEMLRDFLEVRGLGILNIRAMFGDSAIKQNRNLRLILKLEPMNEAEIRKIDRLYGSRDRRDILGVEIPEITLPVAPGRNLAILAEAAARNHMLNLKGFDASKLFMERQSRYLDQE